MKIVNEILTKGLMANGFSVDVKYPQNGEVVNVCCKNDAEQWRHHQKVWSKTGTTDDTEAREHALFLILLKISRTYGPSFMNNFLEKDWSKSEMEFVMGPFKIEDPERMGDYLKAKLRAKILLNGGVR
tara:strand:- start:7420 stop:7803 length:384 start_codon:yes stop_codon:yes gene_type:complete